MKHLPFFAAAVVISSVEAAVISTYQDQNPSTFGTGSAEWSSNGGYKTSYTATILPHSNLHDNHIESEVEGSHPAESESVFRPPGVTHTLISKRADESPETIQLGENPSSSSKQPGNPSEKPDWVPVTTEQLQDDDFIESTLLSKSDKTIPQPSWDTRRLQLQLQRYLKDLRTTQDMKGTIPKGTYNVAIQKIRDGVHGIDPSMGVSKARHAAELGLTVPKALRGLALDTVKHAPKV
jgi:hypothetical protein